MLFIPQFIGFWVAERRVERLLTVTLRRRESDAVFSVRFSNKFGNWIQSQTSVGAVGDTEREIRCYANAK